LKKIISLLASILLIIGAVYALLSTNGGFKDSNTGAKDVIDAPGSENPGESAAQPGEDTKPAATISPTATPKPGNSGTGPANTAQNEMRGVWISTVWNLDWPSKSGLNTGIQKQEFASLLDSAKKMGLNAVMVQVRPMADSIYPSSYFPWSQFLTGKQGENPGYDPLKYMIDETAKRGMKFYAWFNPYRISTSSEGFKALSPDNPALLHPEWVLACDKGAKWLNPGIPEVSR
jgi:uncharacterized lipoprotein YddW (UPF0748 family)